MSFDNEEKEYLNSHYVNCEKCSEKRRGIIEKENDLDKLVTKLDTKLTILISILGAIAVAVIPIAIKAILGM